MTGATGFLGRHLTRRLTETGAVPVLMLRPGTPAPPGVQAVFATLQDRPALAAGLRQAAPDLVFHLAAQTDPSRDATLDEGMIDHNLHASVVLARAAAGAGVARFVFTGTCEEYGQQTPPLTETMAPAPLSPYSAAKAAATLWLRMLYGTHGFPVVIVRPFLVYGPGQAPPRLVPAACLAALAGRDFPMTSGRHPRELTFVADVVEGLLRAATAPAAIGQIINLGTGQPHRLIDLVQRIYDLAGSGGRPLPGALPDRTNEMRAFCADTAKAQALLGWQATTRLDDGLRQTLDWARHHGDSPVPLTP